MPDFNFAKGSNPRDPEKRVPRAEGTPEASASGARKSVLNKYPQRDLSHLTGETPPPPRAEDAPPEAVPNDEAASVSPDASEVSDDTNAEGTNTVTAPGKSSGKVNGPLIAILAIVLFLIVVAFLWHVNPFPSVRNSLEGLFRSTPDLTVTVEEQIEAPEIVEEAAPPQRTWDYFLQVSSWDDLAKADLDAERFRAQGLDVVVESEYIPRRRRTFYRVRLGPYASAEEANGMKDSYAAVLPADAFLDSTRLIADDAHEAEAAPMKQSRPVGRTSSVQPTSGGSEFDVITEPLSGWAVKVSSFKDLAVTRSEARKLLGLGYPTFITRKRIGSTNWYRVLVGPFSDRRDADRYMDLLNVTYGNEAYTVNLATY